jgi:hypothetical protein
MSMIPPLAMLASGGSSCANAAEGAFEAPPMLGAATVAP